LNLRRTFVGSAILSMAVLTSITGCGNSGKVATYSDELLAAAKGYLERSGIVGKSADDIAAAARRASSTDSAAATALKGLSIPIVTGATRVTNSVDSLATRLGLSAAEKERLRGIVIGAACQSAGDIVTKGNPDFAGAIANAVAGEFSPNVSAQQLKQSIAQIWSDAQGGNAFGAAFSLSITLCGLSG